MRVQNYYLIQPKHRLLAMDGIDDLSRDALVRSHLWRSAEGGKTMWSAADYLARAKLAFLINLRLEYAGAAGVERLFAGRSISLQIFDEHWDIQLLELDGEVEEVVGVDMSNHAVERTGLPVVDDWLSTVGIASLA